MTDTTESCEEGKIRPATLSRSTRGRISRKCESVGSRISRQRRERGISQTDLGKRVGVSQRVMSYYEKGWTRIPAESLLEFGDALKVSNYELLSRSNRSAHNRSFGRSCRKLNRCLGVNKRTSSATSTLWPRPTGAARGFMRSHIGRLPRCRACPSNQHHTGRLTEYPGSNVST